MCSVCSKGVNHSSGYKASNVRVSHVQISLFVTRVTDLNYLAAWPDPIDHVVVLLEVELIH